MFTDINVYHIPWDELYDNLFHVTNKLNNL